ncbi:MAG TPA: hypothetical protein VFV17_05965 [Usitatibacteraceae bacterium]|nr:hypothetical protein [Usitatibacteraceae bacterium]
MQYPRIALCLLLGCVGPSMAHTSVDFNSPGVQIRISVPLYPALQRVPGYPVYYAPALQSNYFFYDGLYWVYEDDDWYSSSWYNGPWWRIDSMDVPYYVLRVPVRYYRRAPPHFRRWSLNEPPRWGDHWGQSWQQRRMDWNRWDRSRTPQPAPLPYYQRQYSGNQYPQVAQQAMIQSRQYRYQPADAIAQRQFEHQRAQAQFTAPAPARRENQAVAPPPRDASSPFVQRERQPGANPPVPQRGEAPAWPGNRERLPQASPPPSPRGERASHDAPLVRDAQATTPRPPPQQSERRDPPKSKNPARANDRPDRNQDDDEDTDKGKGKGHDGQRGQAREKKDKDR